MNKQIPGECEISKRIVEVMENASEERKIGTNFLALLQEDAYFF